MILAARDSSAPRLAFGPVVFIAAAVNGLYVVGLLALPSGSFASHILSDTLWTGTSFACAVQCALTARRVTDRRERLSWTWWCAGATVWFVGMLIWSWLELVEDTPIPLGALSDVNFVLAPLCFVPAVWFMRPPATSPEGAGIAAAELGLAASLLFLLLGGAFYRPITTFAGDSLLLAGTLARFCTYTFALLYGVLTLAQRAAPVAAPVAALLLAGLASLAGLYVVFVLTVLVAGYQVGRAFDALWTLAFTFLFLAARLRAAAPAVRPAQSHRRAGQLGWVWTSLFLTLCAGVAVYWDAFGGQLRLLLVGVAALVVFSGLRWALLLRREEAHSERLQETVRSREDFIAVASHELRTPLTATILQLQMLDKLATRARGGDLPADQVQRLAQGALRGTERLQRLIDVLLDLTRAREQRLRMALQDVSLSALLADLVERHRVEFDEAGCTVRTNIAPGVTGRWDPVRLEQVVTNLFSNAMKFGSGGAIDVTLSATPDEAVLAVSDQGIGVAPSDRDKIFERFERAVSVERYGGLGLGLFVSNEIVRALGGTIDVGGEPGHGATFTVRLPRRPPP